MQALRIIQERAKDGYLHVRIPDGIGKRFEIIILPVEDAMPAEAEQFMKLQQEGGFVKEVLAAPEEDVWNEL